LSEFSVNSSTIGYLSNSRKVLDSGDISTGENTLLKAISNDRGQQTASAGTSWQGFGQKSSQTGSQPLSFATNLNPNAPVGVAGTPMSFATQDVNINNEFIISCSFTSRFQRYAS